MTSTCVLLSGPHWCFQLSPTSLCIYVPVLPLSVSDQCVYSCTFVPSFVWWVPVLICSLLLYLAALGFIVCCILDVFAVYHLFPGLPHYDALGFLFCFYLIKDWSAKYPVLLLVPNPVPRIPHLKYLSSMHPAVEKFQTSPNSQRNNHELRLNVPV